MKAKLITGPASEPVSVDDLKGQLRIDHNDEDALLIGYITAAREYAELVTGNLFLTQTWRIAFDEFADCMSLGKRPLQSVSSVTYIDTNGATQTLSSAVYTVDDYDHIPKIYLNYGQSWPAIRAQKNAVLVNAVMGHKQPSERIKQAIILICGAWYMAREDITEQNFKSIPHGAMRLLQLDMNRQI